MALKIRLSRFGSKGNPHYKISVMEASRPRDGKAVEYVGHYHPKENDVAKKVVINAERVKYWLSKGAKPSDKVALFIQKIVG